MLLCCTAPALAEEALPTRPVRIGLFQLQTLRQVQLTGRGGPLRLRLDGRELGTATEVRLSFANGHARLVWSGGARPVRRLVCEPAAGGRVRVLPAGVAPRSYRGRILALAGPDGWLLINELPVEAYLQGLLPAEMPADWPPAALQAQSIAARTYVYANLGKHQTLGFDFKDLTEDQLYRGADAEDARTNRALRLTHNQLLRWRGRPIQALYTSTCGGSRPGNDLIFGGARLAYLGPQADQDRQGHAYCRDSLHYPTWSVSYALADLQRALARSPATDPGPRLDGLLVDRDAGSGYARRVTVLGTRRRTVSSYEFWSVIGPVFGWGEIKSLAFRVQAEGDRLLFIGRGAGHGVGMCQWGARGMALAGADFRTILRHYYPGTEINP